LAGWFWDDSVQLPSAVTKVCMAKDPIPQGAVAASGG